MDRPSTIPTEDVPEHVKSFRRAIDLLGGGLDETAVTEPDGPFGREASGCSSSSDDPIRDHRSSTPIGVSLTSVPASVVGCVDAEVVGLPAASVTPAAKDAPRLLVEEWVPTSAHLLAQRQPPVTAASTSVHTVRRSATGARLHPTVIVQPRDMELLTVIVELRLVTIPLLRRWFFPQAKAATVVNNWLRRMTDAKLVRRQPGLTPNGHALYRPTGNAYHLLGMPGRPRDIHLIEHTLCVAETYLVLQEQGWQVTSERVIEIETAANSKGDAGVVSGYFWTRVGRSVHRVDLVAEKGGSRWHVEVENTVKDQRRYNGLMVGAAVSVCQNFSDGVLYVVPDSGHVNLVSLSKKLQGAATLAHNRLETSTGIGGYQQRRPRPRLRREWFLVQSMTFTWDKPLGRRESEEAW